MSLTGVFAASASASAGRTVARDARSAVWMAAGWAAVTGRTGWVAAAPEDLALARLIADGSRAPVRCAAPWDIPEESFDAAIPAANPAVDRAAPLDEWSRLDGRPIRPERLAADLIAALPPGAILCVDDASPAGPVIAAGATHRSALVLTDVCRPSRGAAVAWAIGAKAAAPQRTVVALTDDAGFAIAAMDVPAAADAGLPIAVVIANGRRRPAPLELVAAIAGGHGESVWDPAQLSIHLRNAMTVTIPTVINVAVDPARMPSLAQRRHPVA